MLTQYSIRPKWSDICNRSFPGPNRVLHANGYLDRFRIFCRAQWVTYRPTDHATGSFTIGGIYLCIMYYVYILKRTGMDHTVLPVNTPCLLSFISIHQMAPHLPEVGDIQLQLTTHLLTPKG